SFDHRDLRSFPTRRSSDLDRLFKVEDLSQAEGDFKDYLNPGSLQTLGDVYAEPAIASAKLEDRFQFLRKGYFCLDPDSTGSKLRSEEHTSELQSRENLVCR